MSEPATQCSCGRPKHRVSYNKAKAGVSMQTVELCTVCDSYTPRPQIDRDTE